MKRLAANYPLTVFFAGAFAISWTMFFVMVVAGAIRPPIMVAATFGP